MISQILTQKDQINSFLKVFLDDFPEILKFYNVYFPEILKIILNIGQFYANVCMSIKTIIFASY